MATVLFRALTLFLVCLSCHILIWRIWKIRNWPLWLMIIFLVGPAVGCGLIGAIGGAQWWPLSLTLLLHCSISISYMLLYTGVTAFSPSIAILQRVASSMPSGLEREQLAPEWFTDEVLCGARHHNLEAVGLISESEGVLRLEWRGRFIARVFLLFRRILGLPDVANG